MSGPSDRASRGHTLLELLVVMTIMTIIMTIMTDAFRPLDQGTLALRDRARAVNELRLATDSLAADLGRAVAVRSSRQDELVLTPDPAWLALDALKSKHSSSAVTYRVVDGDLLRIDASDDSEILVARGIERFELDQVPQHATELTLGVGSGSTARTVHLLIPE